MPSALHIPIKREIAFKPANRSEFIAVMMESGYLLYIKPDQSRLIFGRKIQSDKNGSALFSKKLNPVNRVFASIYPDKVVLRVHCLKIILFIALVNVVIGAGLYFAGMSPVSVWFLAILFFGLELFMLFFNIQLTFETISSKINNAVPSEHIK